MADWLVQNAEQQLKISDAEQRTSLVSAHAEFLQGRAAYSPSAINKAVAKYTELFGEKHWLTRLKQLEVARVFGVSPDEELCLQLIQDLEEAFGTESLATADAYYVYARILKNHSIVDTSVEQLKQCEAAYLANAEVDPYRAIALPMGYVYCFTFDDKYDQAIEMDQHDSLRFKSLLYLNLAIPQFELGKYPQAMDDVRIAHQLSLDGCQESLLSLDLYQATGLAASPARSREICTSIAMSLQSKAAIEQAVDLNLKSKNFFPICWPPPMKFANPIHRPNFNRLGKNTRMQANGLLRRYLIRLKTAS